MVSWLKGVCLTPNIYFIEYAIQLPEIDQLICTTTYHVSCTVNKETYEMLCATS